MNTPNVDAGRLERRVRLVRSGKHSKSTTQTTLGFNCGINDPISNFRKNFRCLDFITLPLKNLDLVFKGHFFCLKFINFIMQIEVYFLQFSNLRQEIGVFLLQIDCGYRSFPSYQLKYPKDMEDKPNDPVQPPARKETRMNTPNVHAGRLERRVRRVGRETRPGVHGFCSFFNSR